MLLVKEITTKNYKLENIVNRRSGGKVYGKRNCKETNLIRLE